MRRALLGLGIWAMLSTASGPSFATVLTPSDVLTYYFQFATPPTGYANLEIGLNFNDDPAGTGFRYSLFDGNNTLLYSNSHGGFFSGGLDFIIANTITTATATMVIDQVIQAADDSLPNVGTFNFLFYNSPNDDFENKLYLFAASQQVSSVPLPAALPLFASGLAGLGWLARRRRGQAAQPESDKRGATPSERP